MSTRALVGSLAVVLAAMATGASAAEEAVFPGKTWQRATPAEAGMDQAKLWLARDYAQSGGGSGYVTRGGRLVMAWGDLRRRYDLKSTTKSIGATALGLAIGDGKMKLDQKAGKYHPAFGQTARADAMAGWMGEITVLQLATQTAGFEKPGGSAKLLFRPGTEWHYSDSGPNWLAECVTLVYGRDVRELMFQRVFTPLGITAADLTWRNNAYRRHTIDFRRDGRTEAVARREFGSGISANVDAMARIGLLYLRGGQWRGKQIIPKRFVQTAARPVAAVVGLPELDPKAQENASDHYGLLWWNNADGTLAGVPRDAFWSWGLYDSLILVVPSLDLVVARAGKSWQRKWAGHYDVLGPFFGPIAASAETDDRPAAAARLSAGPPYPPSSVITEVKWAPPARIVRRARGSDNWPITWADDDRLYTAYGDGTGFQRPQAPRLSLGLASVAGPPEGFEGVNVRSATAEHSGDGARGKKASGMLMVDGRLYMWVRNAGNSQLAWSRDHAKTWIWSDWRFTTSFGYPTFLNFGRDYAGARDEYVYTYSHDSDSAYTAADRMVLARVPKQGIADRDAYEFFRRLDAAGSPVWTKDVTARGAVFRHSGRCYRSGISYNGPLRRYLWCQIIPGEDTRFRGGFGIYDAAEPWGPWTTVFFTERWDVGPGETASFPTKWIGRDGRTLYLVFSGDDSFSVRRATLGLAGEDM